MIAETGCGVLLYLHNTSRGFELLHDPEDPTAAARVLTHADLRHQSSTEDHETGNETGNEAHQRRTLRAIGLGGQILYDLGIRRIRLLSNTPMHIPALEGFGLEIVEQVSIPLRALTPA